MADDPWFRFVLGALATWRVAHLLAYEDGPWDVVARRRAALGEGGPGRLLDCFYCLSFWVAAPIALLVASDPLLWVLVWLALSGAASVIERLAPAPAARLEPVAFQGDDDVLLRPEAVRPGHRRHDDLENTDSSAAAFRTEAREE